MEEATAQIPTHKDWTAFKKKHKIGSNMVGSVNVGKSLDTYHSKMTYNFKENARLAEVLSTVLITYKDKFPDKKGEHKAFLSEFDKNYVKLAVENVREFKTMAGDREAFAGEVAKLMDATAKLGMAEDVTDLQKYRQGPVRGMLAAASKVKTYDPAELIKLWKPLDDIINKLGTDTPVPVLAKVAVSCVKAAEKTGVICKKDGLFTK